MDEGLLNDLLECSVCLERLDTSSRVLPCQHTFCLKCLKVIVESHKELRCPECRILVETKVEELPPNVLLMRILEGMRNATPRKAVAPGLRGSRVAQLHQQAQQSANQSARNEGDKQQPPPYARAIHDYKSKEIGDLSFKKGETILLLKRLDPFWYQGECSGRTGIFPITYVQVMVPLPIPTALCKALYDFRMSAPDEEGCLAFDKGAIITVHRRVDENWAEGRVDERLGIFPIAFVELNHAARQLINSPTLNRPVPPPPSRSRNDLPMQVAHRIQHMSMSTPSSGQHYPNVATMSQSQPNSHTYTPMSGQHHPATMLVQPITSVPRHMPEHAPKQLDFIHLANISNKSQTVGLQSVSRINEGIDRLRSAKYDNYTTSHKNDSTYQNVRIHEHYPNAAIANFNTNSSESSSSANTPSVGISSTTSPNSSSSTSSCESAEPSLPSSPDNGERNTTLSQNNTAQNTTNENETENQELNSSIGVLSLNESSTATNTSLNVSLPTENQIDVSQEGTSKSEPNRLEVPSSSKVQNPVRSGPESLMNFGLGLQAALSPVHARPHKEKRHSLTPPTHLNASQHANTTQNRHSAEILQTSLLDAYPEATEGSSLVSSRSHSAARERDRRRRSRSSECPLPATYVALYPYRPQKPDELELRKGALYTVTERCRDGWFKGHSEREQRAGVFPGNYVAHRHDKGGAGCAGAPAAPPRGPHRAQPQQAPYPWGGGAPSQTPRENTPKTDKSKERSKLEKTSISSGVNLMKRLAAMKKCKSPPPGYSMDNPVFEDSTVPSTSVGNQHVHVRPMEGPWQTQHRKSQSLDATAAKRERDRHHTQTVKERFRCIVPYPPNSEYELELKVDDIVVVHRKRGDGWYKGTLQRTGRCGLFPASFVQSCPAE